MIWNYLGMLSLAAVALAVLSVVEFQSALSAPTSCLLDNECQQGSFCENSQHVCVECLKCEDLKREPLSSSSECIKSIINCGPCLKGLVEDRSDDLSCVIPTDGSSASNSYNTIMWLLVGIPVALIMLAAASYFTYLWRNRITKFQANAQIDSILPVANLPTAPEFPPPYRPNPSMEVYRVGEETDHPLMKGDAESYTPLRYLVTEDSQRANVYNPPAYVRYNYCTHPPAQNEESNELRDLDRDQRPGGLVDPDETTRESPWTPNPTNNNAAAAPPVVEEPPEPPPPAASLSAALDVARITDLVQPPPKRLRRMESDDKVELGDDEDQDTARVPSSRQHNNIINLNIQLNQKLNVSKSQLE